MRQFAVPKSALPCQNPNLEPKSLKSRFKAFWDRSGRFGGIPIPCISHREKKRIFAKAAAIPLAQSLSKYTGSWDPHIRKLSKFSSISIVVLKINIKSKWWALAKKL